MEDEPRNIPRSEDEAAAAQDKDVTVEGPIASMPVMFGEPVGVHEYEPYATQGSGPRQKLRLGKKSRVGEFIVEQLIRTFAFSAFAAIILIFVFVFREASPMFFGTTKQGHAQPAGGSALEQQTYGDEPAPAVVADTTASNLPQDPAAQAQERRRVDSLAAHERSIAERASRATDVDNLLIDTWQPVSQVPKYGMIPLFVGTLKVTLIALLFGAPIAILAALFTSMFAPRWAREFVKPAIELLAGFPSVVIGFFALMVMATFMQDALGYQFRLNSLVGGIAMSFAVIPIIYTISEDALMSVPRSLKEASDALGATKWQTASRVVLPAAVPGVFAAIVLGFGRAFGETMIALMATGNAPLSSWNILEPVRTFSATIGAEMAEVVFGDQHYNVLFFIGALLFIFTFTMNALVEFWVRKRLLRKIQGR